MVNMKKCNYIISVIATVLGSIILYFSSKLGIGFKEKGGILSGTWPGIMGGILIVSALILLIMTIANKKKYEAMEVVLTLPANMRVYVMMGIFVVYCVLLRVLGLGISAFLLIPTVMYVLGERNWKKILIVTVCTIIAIYLIFGIVLGTRLPEPIWA